MGTLKIKRLRPEAKLPLRATPQSAGYDLCACLEEAVTIQPGDRATIPTGIAIQPDREDVAGFVFGRSGLGIKHGIVPSNAVGVIDADYRGEIHVGLTNQSREPYTIQPGERIAQLLFLPVYTPDLLEWNELDDTSRGTGGFGSTGRQ